MRETSLSGLVVCESEINLTNLNYSHSDSLKQKFFTFFLCVTKLLDDMNKCDVRTNCMFDFVSDYEEELCEYKICAFPFRRQ